MAQSGMRRRAGTALTAVVGLIWGAWPLATFAIHKVYSPRVEQGELAVEVRGHASFDDDEDTDGEQGHRIEVEYGLTDYWLTAFFGDFEKEASDALQYTSTGWENIFYLLDEKSYGLGAGLYVEYENAHRGGDANQVEIKFLLEKCIAGFVNTVNLNFEKEVGNDSDEDLAFAYAWRTTRRLLPDLELGLEAFGEVGELNEAPALAEQEHQIGPVLLRKLKIPGIGELTGRLGWLFGLTDDTADHLLKWELEYELP